MIIGSDNYQMSLSRLAYNFNGSISMDYLENASCYRIKELNEHLNVIADDLKNGK